MTDEEAPWSRGLFAPSPVTVPDEVVEAAIAKAMAAGWTPHHSLVKVIIAAALAAWPGAQSAPPDSWTRHKRDAASLILPLQETST
jgi:hypothetical protein